MNGTIVTSLTRNAYDRLRDYLGLTSDIEPEISNNHMRTVRAKKLLQIVGTETEKVIERQILIAYLITEN